MLTRKAKLKQLRINHLSLNMLTRKVYC